MNITINIYTDGSSRGNPGPGGFGVVAFIHDNENFPDYSYSESTENTTNNREELKAILHAFEYAMRLQNHPFYKNLNLTFIIYSDSSYCVNICNDWIFTWARNNWLNSKNKTIENKDLIESLYKYLTIDFFPCQVVKTQGHNKIYGNELADAKARGDDKRYRLLIEKKCGPILWD